jgi:hypothetical protein
LNGITSNNFSGGRNTDTDKSIIQPNQYIEAHNVELVGDGKFFALQNINGTTGLIQMAGPGRVLKTIPSRYLIDGEYQECITIFLVDTVFKILCYNTETGGLYALYQEPIADDYLTEDRIIDAVNYPENGIDFVYFTDLYNEIRFVKCVIPTIYSPDFLTKYDISLLRKGSNGIVTLSSIQAGGSLLSGTYQFSYRMIDPTNKRFTKWSPLTNPIHVYTKGNDADPTYSGVGLPTNREINLTITPSTEESDNIEFIQIAVVENVGPTPATTASLLEITSIPGTSLSFEYKSNSRIGTIPIEDITTPLAAIETAKTINVKENRLFIGNLKYKNLEFDNGTPTVTSGSFVRQWDGNSNAQDSFSSDYMASIYRGYFRDEVYRFGIIYYDEDGNASPVQPLDLGTKITDNQISTGLPDVKFPDRSFSNSYSIFNENNQVVTLGLQLNGITNHPTWASAFEIVRVKRKKNILFQSPIVQMVPIQGVGALDNYPTKYVQEPGLDITVSDAQPQTAGKMLIPRNLYWPEARQYSKNVSNSGSGINRVKVGEIILDRYSGGFQFSQIFPSPNMYGDPTPFNFTGTEKIDFVDYALLKLNVYPSNPSKSPSVLAGDDINTNVAGNFYSVTEGDYYFDGTFVAKSISPSYKNVPIVDYEYFDNLSTTASVSGISVMDYDALQTQGVDWGFKPNIQRCAVVKLGGAILEDVTSTTKTFKNATLNQYSAGGAVTAGGLTYEVSKTNKFIHTYSGYSSSSYVGAIGIVNVKLGLGDDRYGDINAFHEYISTGAKYTFSEAEVATLRAGGSVSKDISVYGGDCFVGPQLFKISDSTYSVVNQTKNNGSPDTLTNLLSKWGKVYLSDNTGSTICNVVALENAAQYIQVVIESEYNGEVREPDTVSKSINYVGFPIYNNNSKESIRIPLSYRYNLNLSKQNDQRVHVPKPLYSFQQNDFAARIAYSDQKIYNSDQAGFDIFRVNSREDLEENKRAITKLALASDNLYAIHQQGITFVPTGITEIQDADGSIRAIGSEVVISRPRTIDSVRGSQHMNAIVETGNVIYIPDNINKSVYVLAGQELKPIIQNNETQFREFFRNQIDEYAVIGVYDPIRKEYWLHYDDQCEVFNEDKGWIATYDFQGLQAGVYTNQTLWLINDESEIYTMYTGAVNQLFGNTATPSVKFAINPDGNTSKTFDNWMIAATDSLATIDVITERGPSGTQTVLGTSIDVTPRDGHVVLPTPRASGARLQGLRAIATIKWKAVKSAIQEVATRYRLNKRTPF